MWITGGIPYIAIHIYIYIIQMCIYMQMFIYVYVWTHSIKLQGSLGISSLCEGSAVVDKTSRKQKGPCLSFGLLVSRWLHDCQDCAGLAPPCFVSCRPTCTYHVHYAIRKMLLPCVASHTLCRQATAVDGGRNRSHQHARNPVDFRYPTFRTFHSHPDVSVNWGSFFR